MSELIRSVMILHRSRRGRLGLTLPSDLLAQRDGIHDRHTCGGVVNGPSSALNPCRLARSLSGANSDASCPVQAGNGGRQGGTLVASEGQQKTGRPSVDRLLAWRESPFRVGLLVTNTAFTKDARWLAEQANNRALLRLRDFDDLRRWLLDQFDAAPSASFPM